MDPAPYGAGGGGTVLEHRYGAALLACLLTGDPVTEMATMLGPSLCIFRPAPSARSTIFWCWGVRKTAYSGEYRSVFGGHPGWWRARTNRLGCWRHMSGSLLIAGRSCRPGGGACAWPSPVRTLPSGNLVP